MHTNRRGVQGGKKIAPQGEGARKSISWTPPLSPSLAAMPGPLPSHRQALGDAGRAGLGLSSR